MVDYEISLSDDETILLLLMIDEFVRDGHGVDVTKRAISVFDKINNARKTL